MSVNAHKYVWTITTKLITCHQVFSSMHHVMSVMLLPLLAVLIKCIVVLPSYASILAHWPLYVRAYCCLLISRQLMYVLVGLCPFH